MKPVEVNQKTKWNHNLFADYEIRRLAKAITADHSLVEGTKCIAIEIAGLAESSLIRDSLIVDFKLSGYQTSITSYHFDEWLVVPNSPKSDISVFWLPFMGLTSGGTKFNFEDISEIVSIIEARLARGVAVYVLLPEASTSSELYVDSLEKKRVEFSDKLKLYFSNSSGITLLSSEVWLGSLNFGDWVDPRLWEIGRFAGNNVLIPSIARRLGSIIRNDLGLGIKAIAVDLDDTLWGGIVGDDGVDGVQLDSFESGRSFLELQRFLVDQHQQGIFIGILSKNSLGTAQRVFFERSEMILRNEHIDFWGVNWQDKSLNLTEMAKSLNIHPDSIVFIDDSAFEISLMNSSLPAVATILLPENRAEQMNLLINSGFFNRSRYGVRSSMSSKPTDFAVANEVMSTFAIQVIPREVSIDNLDRIVSLLNKTNQFNLTSARMTRSSVWDLSTNKDSYVRAFEIVENGSTKGIMSVIAIDVSSGVPVIVEWVLSCRAFSRGIELKILNEVLNWVRPLGFKTIICKLNRSDRTEYLELFLKTLEVDGVLLESLIQVDKLN